MGSSRTKGGSCHHACHSRNGASLLFSTSSGLKPDPDREDKAWYLIPGRRGDHLLLCSPVHKTCLGHSQCPAHLPLAASSGGNSPGFGEPAPTPTHRQDFLWVGPRTNVWRTFNSVFPHFVTVLMLVGAREVSNFLLGASYFQ